MPCILGKTRWCNILKCRFPALTRCGRATYSSASSIHSRGQVVSHDSRNRLSTHWVPTGGFSLKGEDKNDSHAQLIRAGFLRQAHAGIFHMLPMGLRVQQKLENLIDKHMRALGASKVALSSITSEKLWRESGRFDGTNSEMFRLADEAGTTGQLLSPTHEEEITVLARSYIQSYKQLPLRLYQIGRKYRNELRPRQGLLRTREFLMKDLYTFDATLADAMATYESVLETYRSFLTVLRVPFIQAQADSGDMGGDLSHEFHYASPNGEDTVFTCASCTHAANKEIIDARDGDKCPKCTDGVLTAHKAIEVGHTFHLGDRYSTPLGATVQLPASQNRDTTRDVSEDVKTISLIMGCHGIGVTRLIGAVASMLYTPNGLVWPRAIAPFEAVIIAADEEGLELYDNMTASELTPNGIDVVLDDRPVEMAWKLKDADLIGYPVVLVLGRTWRKSRRVEVQCRRLDGLRQDVLEHDVPGFTRALLERL